MKRTLFLLIALSIFSGAGAQIYQKIPGYGFAWDRIRPDSVLHLPSANDTLSLRTNWTTPQIRVVGDSLWWYKSGKWRNLSKSNADTTSLSNRINLKLNISDTSAMLSSYIKGTGTTNYFPVFTNTNTIGSSALYSSGYGLRYQTNNWNSLIMRSIDSYSSFRLESYQGSSGADNAIKEMEIDGYYSSFNSYFGSSSSNGEWRMIAYSDDESNTTNRSVSEWWIPTKSSTRGEFKIAPYYNTSLKLFSVLGNGDVSILGKTTFGGLLSNGTYNYTLPGSTGTLALTSDTASLSSRIDLKLNISDTLTMLSSYGRVINGAAFRIPYYIGSQTFSGSDSLKWDYTNNRFHIAAPSDYGARLNMFTYGSKDGIYIEGAGGATGKAFQVRSDTGGGTLLGYITMQGQASFNTGGSSFNAIGLNVLNSSNSMMRVNGDGSIYYDESGTTPTYFSKNGTLRYFYNNGGAFSFQHAGGNLLLGTDVDSSGYKVQIGGASLFKGVAKYATSYTLDSRSLVPKSYVDSVISAFSPSGTFPYTAKTTAYTATSSDYTINCTTGTFTVSLPTAVGNEGKVYIIKNSGSGLITIDPSGSETIDGQTTYTIVTNESLHVQSTGANWIIL